MAPNQINVDIVIIGGGIAGLWLLNRLSNSGYNALLFEQDKLGGGQSIASQGMIHGGIKYALGGMLTGSSEAIADMPNHWRRCLQGKGDVDLSSSQVLSENFYIWSTKSITSKMTSFFASKLFRGRVETVSESKRPKVFDNKRFKGKLYKLIDLVLDVPSVISNLKRNVADSIFAVNWQQSKFKQNQDGSINYLNIAANGQPPLQIHAQQFIFTAGEGNERLLAMLNQQQPVMQRRPLKQVLLKHSFDLPIYAHCMGSNPSPRLTISSHKTNDGNMVWYLGGDLATEGVTDDDGKLITTAKKELIELFPWLDFSSAKWATHYINRAEPKQKGLIKPDKAFATSPPSCSNVIVGWPTKLTLSPNLSDEIFALLGSKSVRPDPGGSAKERSAQRTILSTLPTPEIEVPCWETLFDNRG